MMTPPASSAASSKAANRSRIPNVLSIAGVDPSGGAGVLADLKAFSALGAYGCGVIAALTAQNTQGVTGVHVPPTDFLRQQIDTLFADVAIAATKIGMLGSAEVTATVADRLEHWQAANIVLDPVMVAKSGDSLLAAAAISMLREALLPLAFIITPNLPGNELTDLLFDGDRMIELSGPRIATRNTHGTGCSLSSAVAALLAQVEPGNDAVEAAVRQARQWLFAAIAHADELDVGSGHGPVHHFHALWAGPQPAR